MDNKDYFGEFIGQKHIKQVLSFHIRGYKATGYFPSTLLSSKRGNGKTLLGTLIGEALEKSYLHINSATVKSVDQFFDQIVFPYCIGRDFTLFFDEAHALGHNKSLENILLSILSPNKEHKNTLTYQGTQITIDNRRSSWIFATTNEEELSSPFRNRLRKISFDEYTTEDLEKILLTNISDILFEEGILPEIATVCRDTARNAVILASDITSFCKQHKTNVFNQYCWEAFKKELSIQPFGLDTGEINYLKILEKHTSLTLSALSSAIELDRKTLQRSVEPYLIKTGLVTIKPEGRHITSKGKNIVREIIKK